MIFAELGYDFYTEKLPFWLVFVIYGVILGGLFIFRGKQTGDTIKSQKHIYYGYAIFFFAYACTRIVFLFSDIAKMNDALYYDTLVAIANLFTFFAIMVLIYTIEKYLVTNTKKAFTIVAVLTFIGNIIFLIISLSVDTNTDVYVNIGRIFNIVMPGIILLLVAFLYIYLIVKTTGKLRQNAIYSLFGLFLIVLATAFDSSFVVNAEIIPIQLSPIITIIGLTFFAMGQRKI